MTCEEIRQCIHDASDESHPRALAEPVLAHLAACSDCRELNDDLETLSKALRAMPRVPLPADALEHVWRKTIDAKNRTSAAPLGFWRLAAASVFATALLATTVYFVISPLQPREPSAVELARASAQADLVFGYTARALAATRDAAAERVLASKVSPAVRGIRASHPSRRP